MLISEASRRREDLDPAKCVPCRFADGQEWLIRKPSLWFCPRFKDGKLTHVEYPLKYGRELAWVDDLVARLPALEDSAAVLSVAATIAGELLRQNYPGLTESELDELLNFRADDPASLAWVQAVVEIATAKDGES